MSIPTNPFDMPPNIPPSQPFTPQNQPDQLPTSYMDPTGAWATFLSSAGTPATAEQVKQFINGMLKMFNLLIEENEEAKKASQRLKRAIEGKD